MASKKKHDEIKSTRKLQHNLSLFLQNLKSALSLFHFTPFGYRHNVAFLPVSEFYDMEFVCHISSATINILFFDIM